MKLLALFILPFCFISCFQSENCGEEVRYFVDMGSSRTKHQISLVDSCTSKKLKNVFTEANNYSLGHYLSLKYNTQTIELETEDFKIVSDEIKSIKKHMAKYNVRGENVKIRATSIYRWISNIDRLTKTFKYSNLDFKVISALEELQDTRIAADQWLAKHPTRKNSNYLVWSIGGQSNFLSFVNDKKLVQFQHYIDWGSYKSLQFALAEGFEIEDLIFEDADLKNKKLKKLISSMYEHLSKDKKFKIMKELIQGQSVEVYGIGGVHKYSVGKSLASDPNDFDYSFSELEKLVHSTDIWKFVSLDSQFGIHTIPNIVFVYTLMKIMKISNVRLMNVGFTDYAILK